MKCITCGKEFTGKRKTAKYCSDACRVKHSRDSVPEERVSVTKVSVTDEKEVSVTKKVPEGFCEICGRNHLDIKENWTDGIGTQHEANLLSVCYTCRNKYERKI